MRPSGEFSVGWSGDSGAVFIWGGHSGLGCRSVEPVDFGLIYTVADDHLWDAGPRTCHYGSCP